MKIPKLSILITATGLFLGAIGGYTYWYYVGCNSGSCLITSSPTNSTAYGLVLGFLVAGVVKDWMNGNKDK